MQIRGKKQMAIYDVSDRNILPEEALEKFYNEGQRITNCSESLFEQHQLLEMNLHQIDFHEIHLLQIHLD